MPSGLQMNPGWEDDLNRQIQSQFQKVFDTVFNRDAGRLVSDVKESLKREFARIGASITDPELTKYATAISSGIQIRVRSG